MPLTDSTIRNKTRENKRRGKNAVGTWYSDSQKLEAVKLWLVVGSMPQVAAALSIPLETIRTWRYSKWWDELVVDIRTEGSFQLSNRLKNVAAKALDQVEDRLDKGEWVLNQKTGELIRKPVKLLDAAYVANSFLDKQDKLAQRPIDDMNTQKVEDRLTALATAFAKFASKTTKVEVIDAIPKEREEGLQKRGSMGEDQKALTFEGSSGEDSSGETGGEEAWSQASEGNAD